MIPWISGGGYSSDSGIGRSSYTKFSGSADKYKENGHGG